MYGSSIFDSGETDTPVTSTSTALLPNDNTTITSLTSKMNTVKNTSIPTSADHHDGDEVDWQPKDASNHDVVMRDKTKQG